jgi:fumarylpyruvate hydrolase
MTLVIEAAPTVVVPTRDGRLFPVRRIFCVGANYAEHARAMGLDPDREPPFFFMKPANALVTGGSPASYPPQTSNLQFEIELVVALGSAPGGQSASALRACIWGYAAGLDMTRRDMQGAARTAGRPWDMSKGFDHSAPIGAIAAASQIGHPRSGAIRLSVNGEARQASELQRMIWSVEEIVGHLSTLLELGGGDLIFTGTPAGTGAVGRGDRLNGSVQGVGDVTTAIV